MFNDRERLVIELADALADIPSNVSEDLYARLRNEFSETTGALVRVYPRLNDFATISLLNVSALAENRLHDLRLHRSPSLLA
jgi:predicted RecB family endonuclease